MLSILIAAKEVEQNDPVDKYWTCLVVNLL